MAGEHSEEPRSGAHTRLARLLDAVLVDPNVHTDQRMHLHREISRMLLETHETLHGPATVEARQRELAEHRDRLAPLLESVLVDPDLHTDTRMRLHRRISRMLRETAP